MRSQFCHSKHLELSYAISDLFPVSKPHHDMKTIVPPSVEVALPTKVVLDPIETAVAEVVDKLDLDSPPAHTLALSQLEQSNPRGWVRPLFFFRYTPRFGPVESC